MHDFSDLQWLRVKGVRRRSRGRSANVVSAICGQGPGRCPKCGDHRSLRHHGRKTTTYRDLPGRDGLSVVIEVDRLRYRCASCQMTSLQPLADMDDTYRMTDRLVERILVEAAQRPFTAIAAHLGIDEKTVRRIVRDRLPRLTRRAGKSRTPVRIDSQNDK